MFKFSEAFSVFYIAGKIVHGYGRGSSKLGIPTANLEESAVRSIPSTFRHGVYFAWAKVNDMPVEKAVVNVGWSPYFDNPMRSIEAHILHTYSGDLYGSLLKLVLVAFHRPEENFETLDALIKRIHGDVEAAHEFLDGLEAIRWKDDEFFKSMVV